MNGHRDGWHELRWRHDGSRYVFTQPAVAAIGEQDPNAFLNLFRLRLVLIRPEKRLAAEDWRTQRTAGTRFGFAQMANLGSVTLK